jgi:hypothetical protein
VREANDKEALVLTKSTRRLLGVLLAAVVSGLAVVPAANATMLERFRFVDDPYAFDETICGIDLRGEGTATGAGRTRTGKGKLASAFFVHVNFAYSETWTADNGQVVTVTGKSNNNEVKAVPLGDNVFRFTDTQAGQPFRLYDSEGKLLLRDRGVIRATFDFDTLGDDEPGGEFVQDVDLSVRGPHPGFEDETLCPVLVPLLTGP